MSHKDGSLAAATLAGVSTTAAVALIHFVGAGVVLGGTTAGLATAGQFVTGASAAIAHATPVWGSMNSLPASLNGMSLVGSLVPVVGAAVLQNMVHGGLLAVAVRRGAGTGLLRHLLGRRTGSGPRFFQTGVGFIQSVSKTCVGSSVQMSDSVVACRKHTVSCPICGVVLLVFWTVLSYPNAAQCHVR